MGTANEEALCYGLTIDRKAIAMPFPTTQSKLVLANALDQMEAALEILDEVEAPGGVGATLDLAIARLRQMLEQEDEGAGGSQAFFAQLEVELSRIFGPRGAAPNPWEIPPV